MLCRPCERTRRAMWRCVTCAISCASTPASCDFVARGEHEAVVHADEAAGQREGVDRVVAHEEEREALRRIAAWPAPTMREPSACRYSVASGSSMIWPSSRSWRMTCRPMLVFVVERERRGGRAADVGQVVASRLRSASGSASGSCTSDSRARRRLSENRRHRGIGPRARRAVSAVPSSRAYQRRNRPAASVRRAPG